MVLFSFFCTFHFEIQQGNNIWKMLLLCREIIKENNYLHVTLFHQLKSSNYEPISKYSSWLNLMKKAVEIKHWSPSARFFLSICGLFTPFCLDISIRLYWLWNKNFINYTLKRNTIRRRRISQEWHILFSKMKIYWIWKGFFFIYWFKFELECNRNRFYTLETLTSFIIFKQLN